ncbi:MAG: chitin-binding protein, partial [Caldilineae bacterium]
MLYWARVLLSGMGLWAALLGAMFFLDTPRSAAHGSLAYPISRIYACYLEGPESPDSAACQDAVAEGGTQPLYDWNEVNLPDVDGQHQARIPDGQLCSAGRAKYAAFDRPRTDWPRTVLPPAASYTFRYAATAPHNHGHFEIYVTRDGYDPTQPLAWADLEQVAVIQEPPLVDGAYELAGVTLPPERRGHHLIYTIWQRHDSPEAFYTCSDVWLGGDPTPTPTPTPVDNLVCEVDYRVVNAWNSGFESAVTITNRGSRQISGWSLTWTFPGNQQITSLWDGVHSQSGSAVTVTNASWNPNIGANGGQAS